VDASYNFGNGVGFYLDATQLVLNAKQPFPHWLLIDRGLGDEFLDEQLLHERS